MIARAPRVVLALALLAGAAPGSGQVLERAPASPHPEGRYLFYLHGRIIEVQGPEAVSPDFGRYRYRAILETFAARGFTVIAQVREEGAGPEFVESTAHQVRSLIDAGVPPARVTVLGFSKGGFLALGVSAAVASDAVGYVILAGCGSDPGWVGRLGPRLRGRFLSLLDRSDRFSPSCEPLFAAATHVTAREEQVFDTGLDHGLFYEPRPGWVDQVVVWVNDDPQAPGGGG